MMRTTSRRRAFDRRTYTTVQQATTRNLRPVMGVLLPVPVLASLAPPTAPTPGHDAPL